MISLKAFLPTLSSIVGMSPAALYERQRALVRLDLLPTPQTRGRNSGGALATPDAVAMMVIAVLATDNLSEMDDRVAILADQEPFDRYGKKATSCPITREKTLRNALAAVLADETKAERISIELARKSKTVRLVDELGVWPSQFGRLTKVKGVELTAVFSDLLSLSRELEAVSKCKVTSENAPQADGQSSSNSATRPPAKESASGTASKARKGRRKSSAHA
jgi:hypothetical protein